MGKKKAEVLLAQRENFINGCINNGIDRRLADKIFELLMHFADYGFNKSHSAAYALLAWQTAYLKANYPPEFMAAMMSSVMDSDKVAEYIELARRMGIRVLPPDINISNSTFNVDGSAIRFGLAAIKNIGQAMIDSVVAIRNRGGKFKSLFDFCCRIDHKVLNKKAIESLVKCGAFDSIDNCRTRQVAAVDAAVAEGLRQQNDETSGQIGLFGEEEMHAVSFALPNIPEKNKRELLAWEMETMGFYISGHPLDEYADRIDGLTSIADIKDRKIAEGKIIKFAGMITGLRKHKTKKGDLMCFLRIEDRSDDIDVTVFTATYYNSLPFLYPDNAVVIQGKVDATGDKLVIIANSLWNAQNYEPDYYLTISKKLERQDIYTKLKTILLNHHGSKMVYLNRQGQWQKLKSEYWVSYSEELSAQLSNLLGLENVRKY